MAPDEGGIREQLKRVTTVLFMACTVHQPSIADTFESDPYLRKLLLSLEQKKWCIVPDEHIAITNRILESIGVNDCFEGVLAFDEVHSITEIEPERQRVLFLDFNVKRLARATKLGFLTAYVGSATEDMSKVANYRIETVYNMQENVPELWEYKCVKKQVATSLARKNGIFNTAKLNSLEAKNIITSSAIVSDVQLKPHAGAPNLAPIESHHDEEAEMGGTSSEKNFSWSKHTNKSCIKLDSLSGGHLQQLVSPREHFEKMSDEDFMHEESLKVMQSLQPGSKKNLLEPMGADKKPKKKHKKEHKKSKGESKSLLPPLLEEGNTSPTNMNRNSLDSQDISAILKAARSYSPSHNDAVHLSPIPLVKPFKQPIMHPSSLFNETQFLPRTFTVA
jgi:hypothetical protein